MRRIRLPGTTLECSLLGFGCADLIDGLGRRESLRRLELAHELGITHFDTARSYGFGEAESMLGDFIARRRDAVTVTTKLGMAPGPRPTRARSFAKAWAPKLVGGRATRVARKLVGRSGATPGHFAPAEANASLETSLRELRTDRVDLLLLHECTAEELRSHELLEFLEASVREGKVRYFGIATQFDSTLEILRSEPAYAQVIQIANSVVERNLERLPPRGDRPVVTHSAIAAGLLEIRRHLTEAAGRAAAWSEAVEADCSKQGVLVDFMLAYAVHANPAGLVLYASQRDDHIRAAVTSIAEERISADRVARFANLVRRADLARQASIPAAD